MGLPSCSAPFEAADERRRPVSAPLGATEGEGGSGVRSPRTAPWRLFQSKWMSPRETAPLSYPRMTSLPSEAAGGKSCVCLLTIPPHGGCGSDTMWPCEGSQSERQFCAKDRHFLACRRRENTIFSFFRKKIDVFGARSPESDRSFLRPIGRSPQIGRAAEIF